MSDYIPENPLIVQSDHTVLLEVHSPRADAARDALTPFAELVKSPEHIHTYRITPLSIWNARATGLNTGAMIAVLREYAKYPAPEGVAQEIEALGRRYGLAVIERDEAGLVLRVADAPLGGTAGP
jgi:DNA excision repair protein ERCC-3